MSLLAHQRISAGRRNPIYLAEKSERLLVGACPGRVWGACSSTIARLIRSQMPRDASLEASVSPGAAAATVPAHIRKQTAPPRAVHTQRQGRLWGDTVEEVWFGVIATAVTVTSVSAGASQVAAVSAGIGISLASLRRF
jgi:hypothetical protein